MRNFYKFNSKEKVRKMRKFLLLCCAACMLLALSTELFAQGYYNRGNRVTERQRIRRGVRSGQLTRAEAQQLRDRQRQIRQERRAYRSDGTLSRDERRDLRRDRREQNQQIRSYRHNDERRGDNDNNGTNWRGNGYYRRGAGSPSHPVFGRRNRY
jgi:cell division protein FtsB